MGFVETRRLSDLRGFRLRPRPMVRGTMPRPGGRGFWDWSRAEQSYVLYSSGSGEERVGKRRAEADKLTVVGGGRGGIDGGDLER